MFEHSHSGKVNIGLNVTRRCNLQCSFCYYNDLLFVGKKATKELIYNIDLPIEEAYQKLSNYNIGSIYICGGEPLTYPLLRTLVDWLIGRAEKIYISTNGILINEDWVDYIVRHDITLLVSVKDSSESAYNRLLSFKNAGIKMHLYHVLTKDSDEILKTFAQRYSWAEKVRLLVETHTNPSKKDIIPVDKWYALLKRARLYLDKIIDKVEVEMGYVDSDNEIAKLPNRGAVNRVIIDVDLKMYPCPLLVETGTGKLEGDFPKPCTKEECPVFCKEDNQTGFKQICPFVLTKLNTANEYIVYTENQEVLP